MRRNIPIILSLVLLIFLCVLALAVPGLAVRGLLALLVKEREITHEFVENFIGNVRVAYIAQLLTYTLLVGELVGHLIGPVK